MNAVSFLATDFTFRRSVTPRGSGCVCTLLYEGQAVQSNRSWSGIRKGGVGMEGGGKDGQTTRKASIEGSVGSSMPSAVDPSIRHS